MILEARVGGVPVARLYREADRFALQYTEGADPGRFVSLTMPVRQQPWVWPRDLHPFFRQNLPEGYLLALLREVFGPHLDGTDFSLLALVGAAGIGRVTVVPRGASGTAPPSLLDLAALLQTPTTNEAFAELVRQHALTAVSGVMPKFLADEARPAASPSRTTVQTARHLIKRSSTTMPDMALNEHYTLQVLSRLNVVPVARTQLSQDGQVLVVERFDVDTAGNVTHGVEDACSLLGLPPHEKYSPSMESVVKATSAYLPDAVRARAQQQIAWQLITNMVVRNGDCHAKNIALTYTSLADVAYAPVYDLVTTQAYDGFRDVTPGLSISGCKSWQPGKTFEQFFHTRLGVGPSRYRQMVEQVCESAVEVGHDLAALEHEHPQWRTTIGNMLHAWNRGTAAMAGSLKHPRHGAGSLAGLLTEPRFATATPLPPQPSVGRSSLLAVRRRRVRKPRETR